MWLRRGKTQVAALTASAKTVAVDERPGAVVVVLAPRQGQRPEGEAVMDVGAVEGVHGEVLVHHTGGGAAVEQVLSRRRRRVGDGNELREVRMVISRASLNAGSRYRRRADAPVPVIATGDPPTPPRCCGPCTASRTGRRSSTRGRVPHLTCEAPRTRRSWLTRPGAASAAASTVSAGVLSTPIPASANRAMPTAIASATGAGSYGPGTRWGSSPITRTRGSGAGVSTGPTVAGRSARPAPHRLSR
jgi:hypothetical protein